MLNQKLTDSPIHPLGLAGQLILGKSYLVRHAFENKDLNTLWLNLRNRLLQNPFDAAALLDMSVILLLIGKRQESIQAQSAALELCKVYHLQKNHNSGLRVLVIVAPGDFMSNTPFEFLLEDSDFNLIFFYVDENTTDLSTMPDHDIALMAISESAANNCILVNVAKLIKNWRGPIINNQPETISQLTRDGVAEQFRTARKIVVPTTVRKSRQELVAKKSNIAVEILNHDTGIYLIRPVDTHAGEGFEKICSETELTYYLNQSQDEHFYISQFIDYQNYDGLFRKYRIVFIDGEPFPSHMAISSHWMVHYLNADMASHESRRKEEESWFASFANFQKENAAALGKIYKTISLDYFVIDCAILPNGHILLFEADVGMIVHDMDPIDLYPYKKAAMKKLFVAFQMFIERKVSSQSLHPNPKRLQTPTFLLN